MSANRCIHGTEPTNPRTSVNFSEAQSHRWLFKSLFACFRLLSGPTLFDQSVSSRTDKKKNIFVLVKIQGHLVKSIQYTVKSAHEFRIYSHKWHVI